MGVLPVLAAVGYKKAAVLLPLLASRRHHLLAVGFVTGAVLFALGVFNSYRPAVSSVSLAVLQTTTTTTTTTSTTTTTTTTTSSTVSTRTAICFANQYNSAQANAYLVLTQLAGEPVRVRGVAVGAAIVGQAVPLLLKQGGDESCALATVETLAADGAFDLNQMMYSVTMSASYSIADGGVDINGMNIALDSLPNGCCKITLL